MERELPNRTLAFKQIRQGSGLVLLNTVMRSKLLYFRDQSFSRIIKKDVLNQE